MIAGNDTATIVIDPGRGLPVPYGVDTGDDVAIGDNGVIDFTTTTGEPLTGLVETFAPEDGGDDVIFVGDGSDLVLGGTGNDQVDAQTDGSPDLAVDIVLGDNDEVRCDTGFGDERIVSMVTTDPSFGDDDHGTTGFGADIALGGVGDDYLRGGGDDLIFGGSYTTSSTAVARTT